MNNRLEAYTIYDTKAESYERPFYIPTEAMAVREFAAMANDPQHYVGRNPEDFHLFHCGNFDTQTGGLEGFACQHITSAQNLVRRDDLIPPIGEATGTAVSK